MTPEELVQDLYHKWEKNPSIFYADVLLRAIKDYGDERVRVALAALKKNP